MLGTACYIVFNEQKIDISNLIHQRLDYIMSRRLIMKLSKIIFQINLFVIGSTFLYIPDILASTGYCTGCSCSMLLLVWLEEYSDIVTRGAQYWSFATFEPATQIVVLIIHVVLSYTCLFFPLVTLTMSPAARLNLLQDMVIFLQVFVFL